jgi:hypothetical protein
MEDAWAEESALLELLSLHPAALLLVAADVATLRVVSRRVRAHVAVHDRWRDAAVARIVLDALLARHPKEVSSGELAPLRAVCRLWAGRIDSFQACQRASVFARACLAVAQMHTGDAMPPQLPSPPA